MFKSLFKRAAKASSPFYTIGATLTANYFESSIEAAVGLYERLSAELPLQVLRDGQPEATHRLAPLLNEPSMELNRAAFISRAVRNLLIHGNCYIAIGPGEEYLDLIWRPEDVAPSYNDRVLMYRIGGENSRLVQAEDMLHIRESRGNQIERGQSKLETLRETLNKLQERQQIISEFGFSSKGFLSGLAGMKSAQVKALQGKLETFQKSEGFAFLSLPEVVKMESWSPDFRAEQFAKFSNEIRKYVFQLFNIPLFLISSEKSNSYKAASESLNVFARTGLSGVLSMFESEFSYKLLTQAERRNNYKIAFDMSMLLKGDRETEIKNIALMTGQHPVLTINDARKQIGLPPLEGGDVLPEKTEAPKQ